MNKYIKIHHRWEHVVIAERILGRPLKGQECVHHVDLDKGNNIGLNLIICPNAKYHKLLHIRTEALDAVGDAEARRCYLCKIHDNIEDMTLISRGKDSYYYHKKCAKEHYDNNKERIIANRRRRRALGGWRAN